MELNAKDLVTPSKLAKAVGSKKGLFAYGNDVGYKLTYRMFDMLVKAISSEDIIFACVGSSMTSKIRRVMGPENMSDWDTAPLPNNFRVAEDGLSILFDFPDTYLCKNGALLRFDKVMTSIIEAASGKGTPLCDDNVRRMQPGRLRSVAWNTDTGALRLVFGVPEDLVDTSTWFDFIVTNRYMLDAIAGKGAENKETEN